MIASGFAGLGLQIVWTQQNALWLGHETAAVLAVVAYLAPRITYVPDSVRRDRLLEFLGRDVRPTPDVREMLAQVREPLLSVLHISPDFRPAYDPLLRMAFGIAPEDSGTARELLAQLVREQPERPEAAEALRTLAATP